MERNQIVLLNALTRRTQKSLNAGGEGFICTSTLSFDVGLNTRSIRRVLDEAVRAGTVERRDNGPGKSYSYRLRELAASAFRSPE